ncbi:MAG: alpha/beta hydrolase [Pseudomonadota bacterium]
MKTLVAFVLTPVLIFLGLLLWLAQEPEIVVMEIPADATAVLNDARFAVPDGWEWGRLETAAGNIRWGRTTITPSRATVIFLPGLSAPLEVYFETFSRLRDEGFNVLAMDWPGQGGSTRGSDDPQKIHARSLTGHVDALDLLLTETLDVTASQPQFLVGLSMGAQLGTRLLARGEHTFDAAALITPAYAIYGGRPNAVDKVLLHSLQAIGFGQRYSPGSQAWQFDLDVYNARASQCSHPNDRTQLWQASMVANPALKVGGYTNSFVLALAESAEQARLAATQGRFDLPVWMPLAGNDVFVENAPARVACDALAQCELKEYPEARHCLFEEADAYYRPFVDDLVAFLNRQVGDAL